MLRSFLNFRFLFTYVPFVFAVLAFLLFVLPCRLKTRAQALWLMALLLCAAKFLCFTAFGGDPFAPELPEAVIWVWNWGYSGLCLLIPLAVVGLCLPRRVRLVVIPLLAWGCAAKGVYNGIKIPEVKEVRVACANLPAQLKGYRILQLSDLHISAAARRGRTEAIVAKANQAQADVIVITGDIVDGLPARQRRNAEPLKDLVAKDGAYFCDGNHDCFGDWLGWHRLYEKWGLRYLENAGVLLREGLWLGGVTDTSAGRAGIALPNLTQAMRDAPAESFRVLLQHHPFQDWAAAQAAVPVDLQLSGHTHGGVAPGLAQIVRHYNHGYLKGLQPRAAGGLVYTSPGTGQWAGFPIRFFNDPELTLLVLE